MPQGLYRVGILGAGYISAWHCQALRNVPGAQLGAICDLNGSRARQLADRFQVPAAYANLDAMLAGESLDVVHVLLPPEHHYAAAQRLLQANLHVLLEKPMAVRVEECQTLEKLAQAQGRVLGVSHNFLFAPVYERLKEDMALGRLGKLQHVAISWNKELGQLRGGPFSTWMFRGPGNIMLEVGPHAVAHLLDLVGVPDRLTAEADMPKDMPNGVSFRRRWFARLYKGAICVELFQFLGSGFSEHTIHVRGSAGSATVDFERNTYVLRRHGPRPMDFDRYELTAGEGKSLARQGRRNLASYILSKLKLSRQGNAYATSIARALQRFYEQLPASVDPRLAPSFGTQVVATSLQIAAAAGLEVTYEKPSRPQQPAPLRAPTVLVLGGTGFIGRPFVARLAEKGLGVRLLVRDPGSLPPPLQELPLEVVRGDTGDSAAVDRALAGITHVVHLARAHVTTWEDYQRLEIEATRTLAEACLRRGVERFVYAGTIDAYYAGDPTQVITEAVPLDPKIACRNLYARAKAESERLLLEMQRERKLPLVIFRPGVVVGVGGPPFHWGVGYWPAPWVCRLWGRGDNPLPLVLVDDVADALVRGLEAPGIVGETFNLVGDPCLSAREYLAELEKAAGTKVDLRAKSAWGYYLDDMFKYFVKVLVRHPGRRLPSYRDWQTRSAQSRYDCAKAKLRLGWQPCTDRQRLIRDGIVAPVEDWLA